MTRAVKDSQQVIPVIIVDLHIIIKCKNAAPQEKGYAVSEIDRRNGAVETLTA